MFEIQTLEESMARLGCYPVASNRVPWDSEALRL